MPERLSLRKDRINKKGCGKERGHWNLTGKKVFMECTLLRWEEPTKPVIDKAYLDRYDLERTVSSFVRVTTTQNM